MKQINQRKKEGFFLANGMSNLFVFKCLVGLKNHTACLFVMESHTESNRSAGEKKKRKKKSTEKAAALSRRHRARKMDPLPPLLLLHMTV